ncbi:MAG: hypothetical protein K2P57_06995 [Burkholderiales bacterium]|nr:hypothetical protein [Burkholderiales bacterium]
MKVSRQVILLSALLLQFLWHGALPNESVRAEKLPAPPDSVVLRFFSLDEAVMASRFMMLYLQSFDIQPGVVIPYGDLDYGTVTKWLEAGLLLDAKDKYPLFSATYLYAGVKDGKRERSMLDFIYREFMRNPGERWQWLAQGALIAKYELHDLPLALEYSEALRRNATGKDVPHWVTQMSIFTLEDMNEIESAKILLGGFLAGGKITDPNEVVFLERELKRVERRSESAGRKK